MKKTIIVFFMISSLQLSASQSARSASSRPSTARVTSSTHTSKLFSTAHLAHQRRTKSGFRSSCGDLCTSKPTPFLGLLFPLPSTSQPGTIAAYVPTVKK